MKQIAFTATIDDLNAMLDFVRNGIQEAEIPKSNMIELALEETLVNIIRHGYPARQGRIEIQCIPKKFQGITFVIKDDGIAFNPLKELPRHDGLGIAIIRKIMDDVHYRREAGRNVLTLIKMTQTMKIEQEDSDKI